MRRILSLVLFVALALSLSACSGSRKENTVDGSEGTPSSVQKTDAENKFTDVIAEDEYFGEHKLNDPESMLIVVSYPSPASAAVSLGSPTETDELFLQAFSGESGTQKIGGTDYYALQKYEDGKWVTVTDTIGQDLSVELVYGKSVDFTIDLGDTLTKNGDGRYRIIKRMLVAGTDAYYSSDFYVLKYADPVLYKKSEYIVDPREELKLSAKYPSAGTSSEESWPGSVDITLELLKDTGIDPIAGNATDCIIEEEIGGVWYTIPRPDYYMTLEGYVPMVGHPVEQTVALSGRVQHPGHYRVLKPVITGRGSAIVHEYYAAEFYVNGR